MGLSVWGFPQTALRRSSGFGCVGPERGQGAPLQGAGGRKALPLWALEAAQRLSKVHPGPRPSPVFPLDVRATWEPAQPSSGSAGPRWSPGICISVILELSHSGSQLDLAIPGFTSLNVGFLACKAGHACLPHGVLVGLTQENGRHALGLCLVCSKHPAVLAREESPGLLVGGHRTGLSSPRQWCTPRFS